MPKIKKYIQLAAANKAGFCYLDLVCAIALIIGIMVILCPNVISFERYTARQLVKNQACILTSDLRRVQAVSRYRTRAFHSILFDTRKERYWFMENISKYELCDLAKEGYGLDAVNKSNVFHHRGTVNAYNYIKIWKKSLKPYIYEIQVLPVTGRVGLYLK